MADVRRMRLQNQWITSPDNGRPEDAVARLGAMQAQEYPLAKWAVGLRLTGITEPDVETAFQTGRILRTHVLRPTWHFVTPADIRWIVRLTAPHVQRRNQTRYRELELDGTTLAAACGVLEQALGDGSELTRQQLAERLAAQGIAASHQRLAYILMHAELECVICSGARAGAQFTYALMDLKAPAGPAFDREAALAELAARYFSSRGPATVHDFANWSGLPMADARTGGAQLDGSFERVEISGTTALFRPPATDTPTRKTPAEKTPAGKTSTMDALGTFLLPDYDEYVMGYRDRAALAPALDAQGKPDFDAFKDSSTGAGAFDLNSYNHWLVVDGRIQGTWQFDGPRKTDVQVRLLEPVPAGSEAAAATTQRDAQERVMAAIDRFRAFWWPERTFDGYSIR